MKNIQKTKKQENESKLEVFVAKFEKIQIFQKFYKLITIIKIYRIALVQGKWGEVMVGVFKNLVVHLRRWMKFLIILAIGLGIILFIVFSTYYPMYSVTVNKEFFGYTDDKKALQDKINEYMKKRRW